MERQPQFLKEIRRLSESSMARLAEAATPPPSAEEQMGLALRPGALVFDLVTGQNAEVLGGSRAHTVIPTAQR
jgi:hypothetical protein